MTGTQALDETILKEQDGLLLRVLRYEPFENHPRHRHDTACITLVFGGALEESISQANVHAGVLSAVIKPADLPHGDTFGPKGAATLQIGMSAEISREYRSFLAYRWVQGGETARVLLQLLAGAPDGRGERDLWAGFADVLATPRDLCQLPKGQAPHGRLADLAHQLDEGSDQGLCVRTTAESMGMHPVSLARAFRRQFGCSITEYIRRARILRAAQQLAEGGEALAGIAADTGFSDQAHFTRAFRAETGLPPGQFRRMVRANA